MDAARTVMIEPLQSDIFAPFGDVIAREGAQSHFINDGNCIRYHDLATVEFTGQNARTLINIFAPKSYALPYILKLVERHPLGSQAFVPLSRDPFLVVVCSDADGVPVSPRAFISNGYQGVNYHANVWHAPLIALADDTDFAVIDRGGDGNNLEEYEFDTPVTIKRPA